MNGSTTYGWLFFLGQADKVRRYAGGHRQERGGHSISSWRLYNMKSGVRRACTLCTHA